jgi:large subunit ribosomal protein L17
MRHNKPLKKLNRTPAHRKALLRNLATSLVLHDSIETTLPKAKALKRVADKLVTLGKTDTLHRRRTAMKYLFAINREATGNAQKLTPVHRLFEEIAPRYADRNGGYTRVLRTRKRDGDKAQMAVVQFVEAEVKSAEPKRKRRVVKKSADVAASGAEDAAVDSE